MKKNTTSDICVLLHNIRSTHNVGSIFRTADALGVAKIYISGYTPAPLDRFGKPRKDVAKVALGAEKNIEWEQVANPKKIIAQLKSKKYEIIAIEQSAESIDYKKVKIKSDALVVVGNEVGGVEKSVLDLCDVIAEIPMRGKKESLNVSVAFAVAIYRMTGM